MTQDEVNSYVLEYKRTGCPDKFNTLYKVLMERLKSKQSYDIRVRGMDTHEAVALYDDTIMEAIRYYREGSFLKLLYMRLKSRRIDLHRMRKRKIASNYDMVDLSSVDILEDNDRDRVDTPEESVIKKEDQRQLISFLVARQDDFTVTVAKLIPSFDSPTAIAKELGVHHSKVGRSLDRLRNRFDANRFGELREYLAV